MSEPCCISPTDRITNVLAALRAELARTPHAGQKATLCAIAAQLEDEWRQYQAGTLPALDATTPF